MVIVASIILLSLIMDVTAGFMGFKEAWGFSQTSYEGIHKVTGKPRDHRPWIWERITYGSAVFSSMVLGALIGLDWSLALAGVLMCSAWGAKLYAVHQWWYNWGMSHWKSTYKRGLEESEHTTANKTTKAFKIRAYVIGWIIILGLSAWILWS